MSSQIERGVRWQGQHRAKALPRDLAREASPRDVAPSVGFVKRRGTDNALRPQQASAAQQKGPFRGGESRRR